MWNWKIIIKAVNEDVNWENNLTKQFYYSSNCIEVMKKSGKEVIKVRYMFLAERTYIVYIELMLFYINTQYVNVLWVVIFSLSWSHSKNSIKSFVSTKRIKLITNLLWCFIYIPVNSIGCLTVWNGRCFTFDLTKAG